MAELGAADLPGLVARFGAALHDAGLPVGPDRTQRLARAIVLVAPRSTRALYWCCLATLTSVPTQLEVFDRMFGAVFGGLLDEAEQRDQPSGAGNGTSPGGTSPEGISPRGISPGGTSAGGLSAGGLSAGGLSARPEPNAPRPGGEQFAAAAQSSSRDDPAGGIPVPGLASGVERLASRDFAELSRAELVLLAEVMSRFRVATPLRRSRRSRRSPHGHLVDLRDTLRQARRTGADPVSITRRRRRSRPRRLVVLCDISGSMEPYARALLQLLYCASGVTRAEVFTFATRLTRLTRALSRLEPALALRRAGELAPDWSGGTRIGAAVKEFNDSYGCRGLARGAVVLIISDGWETGDVEALGAELARLRRVAYRIVWANPRTQSEQYRPLVGGMAVAWPYCDAVVSAHRLSAIDDLLAALASPAAAHRRELRPRRPFRGERDVRAI